MTAPTPPPKYIYKILPYSSISSASGEEQLPSPLPIALPLSALDRRDGFIHLSTSRQLLGTLNNFFASEEKVVVLRICYEKVQGFIKWEDAKGKLPTEKGGCWDYNADFGFFPHIYNNAQESEGEIGLKLGRDEVLDWAVFSRAEKQKWEGKEWCFDEDMPV